MLQKSGVLLNITELRENGWLSAAVWVESGEGVRSDDIADVCQ